MEEGQTHIIDQFAGNVVGVIAYSPAQMENIINTYTLPVRWTIIPRGAQLVLVADDGGSIFLPEYQAILDYATLQGYTLPSTQNQNQQNTHLANLKDLGIWNLLDVYYVFATDGDANFATLNWKNPSQFKCTVNGDMTYEVNKGFNSKLNGYLNTNWRTGTNGVNFTLNNHSAFAHISVLGEVDNSDLFGDVTAIPRILLSLFGTGFFATYTQTEAGSSFSKVAGNYFLQKQASGNTKLWRDGLNIANSALATGTAVLSTTAPLSFLQSLGQGHNDNSIVSNGGAGGALIGKELIFSNAWFAYANPIRATLAYQAIIDRATALAYGLPSANCQTKGRQYILDLMNAGIWDQLDVLYVTATDGSKEFARLNWKSPTLLELVEVNAPPFVSKKGFAPAVSSYLNTGYRPSVEGVLLTQNDHSVFYSIANSVPAFACDDWGVTLASGSNGLFADIRTPAGNIDYRCIQSGANTLVTNPDTAGFYSQKRTASNAVALFKNGISITTGTVVSTTKPNLPVYIGCLNLNGVASNFSNGKQFSVWGAGASLNGKEAANYNAWTTYFNGIQ